jgi:protocatechuate 3,4-dioxygenase beta subunit
VVRAGVGDPVAGAQVELVHQPAPGAPSSPRARAIAGGDGRFRLPGVLPGSYRLRAEHPGLGDARRPVVVGAAADVEGLALALEPRATLHGAVVDARGQPVPGALVRAYAEGQEQDGAGGPVRTDAAGRFRLDDVRPGAFAVEASDDQRGVLVQRGTGLAPGERRALSLRFAGRARVRGQVLWDDGTPARGLIVMGGAWRGRAGGSSTTTGEDGRYAVGPYLPGSVAVIFIEPTPGWRGGPPTADGGRIVRIDGDADVTGVDFRLPRADRAIAGAVMGPDGRPLAGAVVSSRPGRAGARVVTGDDGRFTLADLVPGRYLVRAEYAGLPAAEVAEVEAGAGTVQLRLRAAARLEGVVVAGGGRPPAAATVWARPPSPAGPRASAPAPVASSWVDGADGRFALDGLAAGSYDLLALTADGQTGSLAGIAVEAGAARAGLRLVLGAGVTASGQAVDLETRAPIAGAEVRAVGDGRVWETRTDPTGAFRLTGLPRGLDVQLQLAHPGYLAHERQLIPPLERAAVDIGAIPLLEERPTPGHTGRLGMVIGPRDDGQQLIRRTVPEMPAHRAGVRDGDVLVTIDQLQVTNADASAVVKLLGGPAGTKVVLGIRRGDEPPHAITVERQ